MSYSSKDTSLRCSVIPEVLLSQSEPLLLEVKIVPSLPITTIISFPWQTPLSLLDKPQFLEVHDDPSVDVIIVPESLPQRNLTILKRCHC